jgi:hypothetical protein
MTESPTKAWLRTYLEGEAMSVYMAWDWHDAVWCALCISFLSFFYSVLARIWMWRPCLSTWHGTCTMQCGAFLVFFIFDIF